MQAALCCGVGPTMPHRLPWPAASSCHQQSSTRADLMTTMFRPSWRVGSPGRLKPCTRLTCRSSCLRSCTFRLCVLVLCLVSGLNRVPFKHTPVRLMLSSTSGARWCTGCPCGSLPDTSGNLCPGHCCLAGHALDPACRAREVHSAAAEQCGTLLLHVCTGTAHEQAARAARASRYAGLPR